MSETKKSDSKKVKKNTEKSENTKTISENEPKGTNLNSGDSSKKMMLLNQRHSRQLAIFQAFQRLNIVMGGTKYLESLMQRNR